MDYNAEIEYIKGKENQIADFFSRINIETEEINLVNFNTEIF